MGILDSAKTAASSGWRGAKATVGWGMTSGAMSGASMWNAASIGKRRAAMAAGGALYGGTIGRDPGQSRLGGAMTGAIGGSVMYGAGRYGRAGALSFQRARRNGASTMDQFRRAGIGMFAKAMSDGKKAGRLIGNSATKANQGIGRIRSTLGG